MTLDWVAIAAAQKKTFPDVPSLATFATMKVADTQHSVATGKEVLSTELAAVEALVIDQRLTGVSDQSQQQLNTAIDKLMGVCLWYATFVNTEGDFPLALDLYEILDEYHCKTFGPNSVYTTELRLSLARTYFFGGKYEQAVGILDAYEASQEVIPDTAQIEELRNFIDGRQDFMLRRDEILQAKTVASAQQADDEASKLAQFPGGPVDYCRMVCKADIASMNVTAGNMEEAIQIDQKNLVDQVRVLGYSHCDTLNTLLRLATGHLRREPSDGKTAADYLLLYIAHADPAFIPATVQALIGTTLTLLSVHDADKSLRDQLAVAQADGRKADITTRLIAILGL